MTENVGAMLILVQGGKGINEAAKRIFGNAVYYHRNVGKEEKSLILRARREYLISAKPEDQSRLVEKRITMPISRRNKLQRECDKRKESVNVVANRLFNLFIKHPDLFERVS